MSLAEGNDKSKNFPLDKSKEESLGIGLQWGEGLGIGLQWGEGLGIGLQWGEGLGIGLQWGEGLGIGLQWEDTGCIDCIISGSPPHHILGLILTTAATPGVNQLRAVCPEDG